MFKVLVLQKFHGLSDDATEEQIFDRTSFKNFVGLRIGDDIPDAKTLWDFKQRIEEGGRAGSSKLFEAFGQMLESKGIVAREGSIVGASFVAQSGTSATACRRPVHRANEESLADQPRAPSLRPTQKHH